MNFARLGLLSLKTIALCLEPCKDAIIGSFLLPYQFIENKEILYCLLICFIRFT